MKEGNEKMSNDEKVLFDMLKTYGYKFSQKAVFQLASGQMSRVYIDCKTVSLIPEGLSLIGKVIFDKVKDLNIQTVGGLEFGAIPLAIATSMIAFQNGIDIRPFIVRKQPKDRGLKKLVEGVLNKDDRVVILEDVITTGKSAISAIKAVKDLDIDITIDHVLAIVDRQEEGIINIFKEEGYKVESIFKITDFYTKGETDGTT